MNVLALDLGTKTGYAILCNERISSGVKKLPKKTFGSRFAEFRSWLLDIMKQNHIDVVCFERAYRHNGTEAAHVFGGFMYTLAAVCDEQNVQCEGLSVSAIKKYISGKGNATKEEMVSAIENLGFKPTDDNEADALGVLLSWGKYTNKTYGSFQSLAPSGNPAPDAPLAPELFSRMTGLTPSVKIHSARAGYSCRRRFRRSQP